MNSYYKFYANVWLAKTEETYAKNDTILISNKYGKESEHKVHNLVFSKNNFNYYSVERLGETYAERKAKRYEKAAERTEKTADSYYQKSNKDRDFLVMGEPIKVGHHSEKRHRKVIEEAHNNMRKFCEASDKAREQERRAEYWKMKADEINLSSPESIEFFTAKLEQATEIQQAYKTGKRAQEHSYALSYATKAVKDIKEKLEIAVRLWGSSDDETTEPEAIAPETIETTEPAAIAPETIETKKPAKKQTPAQTIKSALKKSFPETRFSVKYKSYSMGDHVDISWIDGPRESDLKTVCSVFLQGHFDSMNDYYEISNYDSSIPQTKYIFYQRKISECFAESIHYEIVESFNFPDSFPEWQRGDYYNTEKRKFWEWAQFENGVIPSYSDFIKYEEEKQLKAIEERKIFEEQKALSRIEFERLQTIENKKMYFENSYSPAEIEEHKTGLITTGKIKIYDSPVYFASVWPDMNKNNTLSEYHAELITGDCTHKTARVMGEIVLSDNSARTYAEYMLYGQNFIAKEFKDFCGHDLPINDERREEFEKIDNPWNMSENQLSHFQKNSDVVCFIVKSEICTFLVNSEGCNYARYVGFIE